MSGQDTSTPQADRPATTGQDSTGQDSTGQDSTGQDSTGQDSTGQDSTGQKPAGERAPARGPGPTGPLPGGPGAFSAGASTEKALDFSGSGKRLLRRLGPQRHLLLGALLLAVASVVCSVVGPKLLGRATDAIFDGFIDPQAGIDFAQVRNILLLVLAVYLAAFVLGVLQGRLVALLVQRAIFALREEAQAKLTRLPLRYFDGQPRGEVLSRVTNDVDNLQQSMQQTFSQLVTALLTIVGVLSMMFWISPLLALIALITVPLSLVVTVLIGKRAQPLFVRQWSSTGRLNGHVEEMYTGHALVTVFGRQQEASATFTEQNEELYRAAFGSQFISGLIQPSMMFISNLNYVLVSVVGGIRVANGHLSVGDVTAFITYSRQFGQPLTQVASMANLLQSAIASAERIFALLDATEQSPDPAQPAAPAQVLGRVEFDDVSFRYLPDQPLIEHLSLSVEPGRTVAIVGPTGAGKTTLVNLLMRFYELDGGQIRLDGVDTATMTRDTLREQFGMVLQDAWLFGGTIEENIAYGADNASLEDVVAAARASHVDAFVRALPNGYDTVLDDEASDVSAGERQLITIARAFLARPQILILDEATSSVDTRTEVLIQQAMGSLRRGRTSFVIAHRLSTIRDADVILVMESGRIVEQGDHEQLLAAQGAYARLYAAQFAQPAEAVE